MVEQLKESIVFKSSLFTILLIVSVSGYAEEGEGSSSVLNWLSVIDSSSYAESWNQAAPYFQKQLSSRKWEQALTRVRTPLGKIVSRKVIQSSKHNSLPGVPDGEYIVFTLATTFENKKSAVETVTVVKVEDQWRAVGYFIK